MRFTSYSSAIEKNYNVLGGGKETEIKTKGIFYNKKFTDTNELKLAESSLTLYFSQFFYASRSTFSFTVSRRFTGFHSFHVLVGTIALSVSFARMVLNHFTNTHHFGFEAAIW